MATATSPTAPQYVQQAFNWDEIDAAPVIAKQPSETANIVSSRKSKSQPLTVPTFSKTSSVRRGRCEHVGGILASVLERYGIGMDQLLAEIEK